jgi:hypothetical protein
MKAPGNRYVVVEKLLVAINTWAHGHVYCKLTFAYKIEK